VTCLGAAPEVFWTKNEANSNGNLGSPQSHSAALPAFFPGFDRHGRDRHDREDAMHKLPICAAVLVLGAGSVNAQPHAIEVKGFALKPVAQQVLAGYLTELNGRYKMTVAEFTFAPGGHVGPHHHAGPGFRCVLSGEVTNVELDKTTIYRAGECYWESGDISHTPRNDGDKPAVGLVIELLPASFAGKSLLPVPK
jgi:quercetin dioxygenase-like cupin family protein